MFQDNFYKLLEKHYTEQPSKKPFTREKQLEVINAILEAKIKTDRKTRRDYYLLSVYDVLSVEGDKNYLIKKMDGKIKSNDQVKYVVPYEDLFDRLTECHIKTGHGGSVKMRRDLKNRYCIPRPAIEAYLKVCKTCNKKKGTSRKVVVRPIISEDFNERGQFDLIDYQSMPDGDYKWILNYQDHSTKFLCLRPLKAITASEVALELLKIFLTFGAPKILQSDNEREFVNQVIVKLKEMWPACVIINGRPQHPLSQGSNQDVEYMLQAWMNDNKCKNWSMGLHFVQWQKNTSFHRVIGRCPYRALFGSDPKVGLSSTDIPQSILKNILTEEDLEALRTTQERPETGENEDEVCLLPNLEFHNPSAKTVSEFDADIEMGCEVSISENSENVDFIKCEPPEMSVMEDQQQEEFGEINNLDDDEKMLERQIKKE